MRYETNESVDALIEEIEYLKTGFFINNSDEKILLCTISCGRDIGKNNCRGCVFDQPLMLKPGYCYHNTDEVLNSLKTYDYIKTKTMQESEW